MGARTGRLRRVAEVALGAFLGFLLGVLSGTEEYGWLQMGLTVALGAFIAYRLALARERRAARLAEQRELAGRETGSVVTDTGAQRPVPPPPFIARASVFAVTVAGAAFLGRFGGLVLAGFWAKGPNEFAERLAVSGLLPWLGGVLGGLVGLHSAIRDRGLC